MVEGMGNEGGGAFPEGAMRGMPKGELHVHLEGSVGAETLLRLAAEHGVTPPAPDAEGVRRWFTFNNFAEFLERYFFVCHLLKRPEDFRQAAFDYLMTADAQGAVHVEFHVSASYHVAEVGSRWVDVLGGIVAGCDAAEAACGISALLIPDLSPHMGAAVCGEVLDSILGERHGRVVALGMGGPSDKWFTEDYAALMRRGARAGLRITCHAGEHGPAREIAHAVREFGAERIQHGIKAVDDAAVTELLRERGIACDVCPASNVALKAVAGIGEHPMPRMLAAGLTLTLGSDDPPFFHTSLLGDYRLAYEGCGVSAGDLARMGRNSLACSFAAEERKRAWIASWEAWAGDAGVV